MTLSSLLRKKNIAQIMHDADAMESESGSLKKNLTVRDLTAFGIAAIVGAGIFSTIGNASFSGGPAVIFLFIFTAIACTFSAFAYAEFASMIPVAGSAYTYSYVAFGELIAWIIGWDLLMEYAIGNIAVAISWSDYFTSLLSTVGYSIPEYWTMDFLSAWRGHDQVAALLAQGTPMSAVPQTLQAAYLAWSNAPVIFGMHLVADLPALLITVLITWLVYVGIKESKQAGNMMVAVKLAVILGVIAIGAFFVDTRNWVPFAPNGVAGVLKGVSAVFFAYIGFDAISTTAEECNNPQRDLPRGMFYSIVICTVLYVAIALVLTGMVHYNELNVGDPLAYAFEKLGMHYISGIIAVSAVVAMASVLLVFQLGQPRIWMSMSRDGLLPKVFSRIHPKYRTPSFSTILTGFVVAVPALFMNLTEVTDLTSIGTLFAFVLVCGGVLQLQLSDTTTERRFKTPYINSKYIIPVLAAIALVSVSYFNSDAVSDFLHARKLKAPDEFISGITPTEKFTATLLTAYKTQRPVADSSVASVLASMDGADYRSIVRAMKLPDEKMYTGGWDVFKHQLPLWLFFIVTAVITALCWTKNLSLIPVLGLISCLYLMSELGFTNWMRFLVWLTVGLIVYFTYSRTHSHLAGKEANI
ncbi:MAG TPA: amino acid permease [Bacteroidota bacterium]|nr:amino acid permease [Bacteroidota bacterium]